MGGIRAVGGHVDPGRDSVRSHDPLGGDPFGGGPKPQPDRFSGIPSPEEVKTFPGESPAGDE